MSITTAIQGAMQSRSLPASVRAAAEREWERIRIGRPFSNGDEHLAAPLLTRDECEEGEVAARSAIDAEFDAHYRSAGRLDLLEKARER